MYSFRLPNGELAHYQWGSSVIRLGYLTPITKNSLIEFITSYLVSRANWVNDAQFRAHISLQHEAVHYYQDLLTGVGHWDFEIRRLMTPMLMGVGRQITVLGRDHPEVAKNIREFRALLDESLLYFPSDKLPLPRKRWLASAVVSLGGRPEDASWVEIGSLLEAEAVSTTFILVLNLPKDEDQSQIALRHAPFYQPYAMPQQYQALWMEFAAIVREALPKTDDLIQIAELTSHFVRLFVDLALAHPSTRMVRDAKLDRTLYEPGLKLLYLMRAFHRLPDSANSTFIQAFRDDPFEVEKLLLAHCQQHYLTSREIYSDWLDFFEQDLKQKEDPLVRLRADACRARLDFPLSAAHKSLLTSMELRIPLHAFTPQGPISYLFNRPVDLSTDEWRNLGSHILSANRDAALIDHFIDQEPFVCPLAEIRLCDAANEDCLAGIRRGDQFPAAQECEIRADLEERDFVILPSKRA